MRLTILMLALAVSAVAQQPRFSITGTWGTTTLYAVSVCNPTPEPLEIYGNAIWAAAQSANIAPMTHSQLAEYIRQQNRKSVMSWVRTLGLVATGGTTAAQALGVGEHWKDGLRVIAPAVGAALVIAELVADRQAPLPLEVPPDYLPSRVDIPAGDCWVGTLVGSR